VLKVIKPSRFIPTKKSNKNNSLFYKAAVCPRISHKNNINGLKDTLMNDNKLLVQMTEEELRALIKSSVQEIINQNKGDRQTKDLLTSKEVISLLEISPSTLFTWKREGKIPFHRLNGRNYFKYDEIIQSLTDAGNTKVKLLNQNSFYRGVN
jgi:hypothetical protein